MTLRIGLAVTALALGASVASAEGINLSWNDCGSAGTQNATFACNTNTGLPFSAVASYVPPAGIARFLGLASQMDIYTELATLPDWWKHGTSGCRGTSGLAVNFDFTSGPFVCQDFYVGQAAGGFAYDVGFGSAGRARFRIQCAVPFDNLGPIDAGFEYYAYKANFTRSKTSGTGFCDGCQYSACLVLNEIQLFQPPDALNDPRLYNSLERSFITWQLPVGGPIGCPLSTPTRNSSWGRVKSMYR